MIYSINQFIFCHKKHTHNDYCNADYHKYSKTDLEHWFEHRQESLSEYDKTPKEKMIIAFFMNTKDINFYIVLEVPDLFVI